MQHNNLATGRKVYSTGSYAPKRTKKRKGYIEREIRRRNRKRMKAKAVKVNPQMARLALQRKLGRG